MQSHQLTHQCTAVCVDLSQGAGLPRVGELMRPRLTLLCVECVMELVLGLCLLVLSLLVIWDQYLEMQVNAQERSSR